MSCQAVLLQVAPACVDVSSDSMARTFDSQSCSEIPLKAHCGLCGTVVQTPMMSSDAAEVNACHGTLLHAVENV